ncbi:MAG: transcription-repair coupling factor, partial [Saprospiraceae bacterium]|nr:transcription-repair coupling factor [Saprospiraceae bacterium]
MSNISHLLERYRDAAQLKALAPMLSADADTPARIQLNGLVGSQRAFVMAALALKQSAASHLILAESKEEGAYLHNDLESLLPGKSVFFFPDSFKRPAFFDELNPTQVLQRSEVVSKAIGDPESSLVVTYPEALFEKVVNPNVLAETRIHIATGERLDIDFVIEVLIEYGFERTDFVYEPGQFSIRGGIIDLFSWGNDLPYRIELFDDEVESIRTFDPLTQLSKQNISQVNIVPNLNTRFRQDQKVSLLEVLPPGTVVWIKDQQFVLDRLQYCFDKAEQYAAKISALDTAELREIFRDRAFLYPREVTESLAARSVVFFEKQGKGAKIDFQ